MIRIKSKQVGFFENKNNLKVIHNSKVKRNSGISKENNTLDYEALDKTIFAKCKIRKCRLINTNAKKIKDDCKVDYFVN